MAYVGLSSPELLKLDMGCNCHSGPFPLKSRSFLLIAVDFRPFFVRIHHLRRKLTVHATTKSATEKPAIRRSFYRRLRKNIHRIT